MLVPFECDAFERDCATSDRTGRATFGWEFYGSSQILESKDRAFVGCASSPFSLRHAK